MASNILTDEELIERHIDASPGIGGPAEARLRRSWVPVWAVIGQIPVAGNNAEALGDAYEIPVEEAEAALAYYRRHHAVIDARLDANRVA